MTRASWDYDHRPVLTDWCPDPDAGQDLIVATETDVDAADIGRALAGLTSSIRAEVVLSSFPVFWTRVRTSTAITRSECAARLRSSGVAVRYVTSSEHGCQELPPPLVFEGCRPRRATRWGARTTRPHPEHSGAGRWFLDRAGLDVRRACCGTGAGTRLAVIDDDAGDLARLDLDAAIPVGVMAPPRGSSHGAQLVAWATRATVASDHDAPGEGFVGVAPDASTRVYFVPKPGHGVLWLPLAILRAVDDGADVVLCATNVDGATSPMLDDALEVARRLGRDGRGAAVILPCGRETSSADGSLHASLSLGASEPASDPRAFCISPSGRDGGWFLWRDRLGRLRPFANRTPSQRWMAPGDDVAHPFGDGERLAHAESSGAAAMAAGVVLLLLGVNPELTMTEVDTVLSRCVAPVPGDSGVDPAQLADGFDLLPLERDLDGHNAKHGYGRLDACAACLVARDPVAAALVYIGEKDAAAKYLLLRRSREPGAELCSDESGKWAATRLLVDTTARHAVCAVARNLRLLAADPTRRSSQAPGAILRQLAIAVRLLASGRPVAHATRAAHEIDGLARLAASATRNATTCKQAEARLFALATDLWPRRSASSGELLVAPSTRGGSAGRLQA